jgi:hypothetical protein
VAFGKLKVGEGVMLGVRVIVEVSVGVNVYVDVGVDVGVCVGVKVNVYVDVFVHMAAVAVWAMAVRVVCSSGEGPQAETRTKMKRTSNDFLFIISTIIQ